MKPQIFISAATAGSGKTLFAMGLSRLLKRRGYRVQPYKCGPDFFDSQLLSIASGNDTVNLDAWLSTHNHAQYLYNKYGVTNFTVNKLDALLLRTLVFGFVVNVVSLFLNFKLVKYVSFLAKTF